MLRPLAGVWIDRHGIRPALLTGAALVVMNSLALQAAGAPVALIALMAVFGVGFGLTTMLPRCWRRALRPSTAQAR